MKKSPGTFLEFFYLFSVRSLINYFSRRAAAQNEKSDKKKKRKEEIDLIDDDEEEEEEEEEAGENGVGSDEDVIDLSDGT